jgi:hypothetical protein
MWPSVVSILSKREGTTHQGAVQGIASIIWRFYKCLNHYYYEKKNKETFKQQIDFVSCDSCFWCASSIPSSRHFMINDNILSKCPVCDNDTIKLNPILTNDAYMTIIYQDEKKKKKKKLPIEYSMTMLSTINPIPVDLVFFLK